MQFLSETPSGRSLVESGFRFPSSQVVAVAVAAVAAAVAANTVAADAVAADAVAAAAAAIGSVRFWHSLYLLVMLGLLSKS